MILLAPDAVADLERVRAFLDQSIQARPDALALISTTIERLQDFPALGTPTEDPDIHQIVIRFGASGYIIRYAILPETSDVLITRVWHGREARV